MLNKPKNKSKIRNYYYLNTLPNNLKLLNLILIMKSIFSKKIKALYIIPIILFTCIVSFLTACYNFNKNKSEFANTDQSLACNYNLKRLEGYKFIKPLLFVDDDCEGDNLAISKQEINNVIENYKATQGVISSSVYIREYQYNSWTAINEELEYEPGSLFKVPILMAYLKLSEKKPNVLEKELLFDTPFAINKNVAYQSKQIKLGSKYTVRQLLTYMITYSDNNATALLNNNLEADVLYKLFADLNLVIPDIKAQHYYFTVKDYSLFLRTLYNATYLSVANSEYAMELLEKCEFKGGIVNGLPSNVRVAHKFGESGTPVEMQLHESAIIYDKDKTYLLTVMTKGKDNKSLSSLISKISELVHKNIMNINSVSMASL